MLPRHISIKGNELAEKLATLATANSTIDVDIDYMYCMFLLSQSVLCVCFLRHKR